MARSNGDSSIDDVIRSAGLRVTAQRVAVLRALMDTHADITAQALHALLVDGGAELGLATVYRTLGALVDAGIVDALKHGQGTCYRWCEPGHHHHLTCDDCHAVVELREECAVGHWAEQVGAAHGFSDVRHVVELHGRCSSCHSRADS